MNLTWIKFIIVIGLLFTFSLSNAQVDARAQKVLKASQKAVNDLKDITVTFKKSLESVGEAKKQPAISGTLKVKKNSFRIELSDRMIVCNGKTSWDYLVKDKEVTISNYDPQEGFNPEKIFRIPEKDMNMRYDAAETFAGSVHDKLSLFPKSKNSEIFQLEVWVNQKNKLPAKLRIKNRNGSVVLYELTDLKPNTNLGEEIFTFNPAAYPGVEVIDNR